MSENKLKRQYSTNAFVVIMAFVALAAAAIFGGVYQYATRSVSTTTSMRIPVIRTPLVSANDGQEYTVQTQFYVQMDSSTRLSDITQSDFEQALTEIMESMDFDTLAGTQGVEYVNQRATRELNRRFFNDADTVTVRALVTDLIPGDDRLQLQDPVNNRLENFIDGTRLKD